MNEIILALTWFKSLLAWWSGRVAYFKVFEDLLEIKVFVLDGLLKGQHLPASVSFLVS